MQFILFHFETRRQIAMIVLKLSQGSFPKDVPAAQQGMIHRPGMELHGWGRDPQFSVVPLMLSLYKKAFM